MLTRITLQGATLIKTGVCNISPPWRIPSATKHNELLAFPDVSRHLSGRCRLFADYNIALGILSKLSKQEDRSPTIADIYLCLIDY